MGSRKESPEYWVSIVKPGRALYEIGGVSEIVAREAILIAVSKMPIQTLTTKPNIHHPDHERIECL